MQQVWVTTLQESFVGVLCVCECVSRSPQGEGIKREPMQ